MGKENFHPICRVDVSLLFRCDDVDAVSTMRLRYEHHQGNMLLLLWKCEKRCIEVAQLQLQKHKSMNEENKQRWSK